MKSMYIPKLPLKFILLWIINLAVLLTITLVTGADQWLLRTLRIRDTVTFYLIAGAVLALLEQALIDKLRGE